MMADVTITKAYGFWVDTNYYSEMYLPIGRLILYRLPRSLGEAVAGYRIVLEDGEYGDGGNFAEKETAITDLDTAKQEAIAFLREKIQETLALLDDMKAKG